MSAGCAGPVSKLPTASPTAIATEQYRQQLAAVRAYYRDLGRIDNVAFRIRTANTRFCKHKVAAEIGLFAGTMRSLPRKYHSVAGHTLDLSWDTPRAISVA
ncbi:MAG: hypothetical protein P8Y71_05555, partial [Pseudolabrys sp.]